jgi:hypothetical protein
MKSSSHSLMPFLPSLPNHLRLPSLSILCCNCQLRKSLYSLGAESQKTPLSLLLLVDSLLQRCVYRTAASQRAQRGPTENATCNISSIVARRHGIRDAFLSYVCMGHYSATAVSLPSQVWFEQIRHSIANELHGAESFFRDGRT